MTTKPNPQKDYGCSCGQPSCRYDAHYGNPLREVEAQPKTNPLAAIDAAIDLLADADAAPLVEVRAAMAELVETYREVLLEINNSARFCTDVMQRIPSDTMQRATAALAAFGEQP